MQHIPATIEEQLLLKAIREESPWENLPKRLQAMLISKDEWHKRSRSISHYCISLGGILNCLDEIQAALNIFAEQPYDSIPNFSAADALRLTGIGRNEYIDIMNKCRSKVFYFLTCAYKGFAFFFYWWELVYFECMFKLTEEEMATIDKVCKEEVNSFFLFDPNIVRGLHRRGLMYFDVPVYPDDRFKGMHGNNHLLYEL
ncbi:hypothetical protein GW17_00003064 [Ensete ventricosum]|nr:hypothetical protein GW17_00003064 [Ensete ventricosum]